jgi:hypothetical protein
MGDSDVILLSGGLRLASHQAAFPARFERKVGAGVKQEVPKECDIAITGLAWNGQVTVPKFARFCTDFNWFQPWHVTKRADTS